MVGRRTPEHVQHLAVVVVVDGFGLAGRVPNHRERCRCILVVHVVPNAALLEQHLHASQKLQLLTVRERRIVERRVELPDETDALVGVGC